jgi:hypothetical protein
MNRARELIAFYVLAIWGAVELHAAFYGLPATANERVLGLIEGAGLMVLGYYFTASPTPPKPPGS